MGWGHLPAQMAVQLVAFLRRCSVLAALCSLVLASPSSAELCRLPSPACSYARRWPPSLTLGGWLAFMKVGTSTLVGVSTASRGGGEMPAAYVCHCQEAALSEGSAATAYWLASLLHRNVA